MIKEVKGEVIRLLKESKENIKSIEIIKEVKIQHSKQLFIRIPRELERLLLLKKGGKVQFVVKMPPRSSKEKVNIKLRVVK